MSCAESLPVNARRILLLCHVFNSLSQRLFCALRAQGHEVSVELDIADAVTEEAVALFRPDLVVAPYLRRKIPASVWQRVPCLIVHPGPPGDRGPSALDWAVLERAAEWGVTVLQATDDFDAGPVWAAAPFAMRAAAKGSLYRREVGDAALACVLEAVARVGARDAAPPPAPTAPARGWRAAPRLDERRVDWRHDDSARVLAKLRSADGQPGLPDMLFERPCALYDPHPASTALLAMLPAAPPGSVQARRDGALLRRTRDGAVWIGQARLLAQDAALAGFKLPCSDAFGAAFMVLPERAAPLERAADEWGELRYRELGDARARVGVLSFDFYNGAMSTAQCERLLVALRAAKARPTRVLLLTGGADFFSNGIHLNCIEAAAQCDGDSAADESWRNINAMNDVALELITLTDRLTIAALRGNAGAGGAFLALAADEIWAHRGVVLNPHYKNMGNLYGSEYWTYLLPRRLGAAGAAALMQARLPIAAAQARALGLIDACSDAPAGAFEAEATTHALALAGTDNLAERLARKQQRRMQDEARRPLADHRREELSRMHRNFYGFDPSYHVARYHFVHKLPLAWTPRHLALHRETVPRAAGAP